MNRYYLSLVRGLVGYYVLFEAPDEYTVRRHAQEYFGRVWCSVYEEDYFNRFIVGRYGESRVINADRTIVLESWQWE